MQKLGEAEIHDLGLTPVGYKNIGRLNVSMNDPFRMCDIQRVSDLNGEIPDVVVRGHGALFGLLPASGKETAVQNRNSNVNARGAVGGRQTRVARRHDSGGGPTRRFQRGRV